MESLFNKYQPIVTKVVYKFSFIGRHKKSEDMYKYYTPLEFKGLDVNDLYQVAEIALIQVIEKMKSKKVQYPMAYVFKALYREIKHYITKQSSFSDIESLYEKLGEPVDSLDIKENLDNIELKNIINSALATLDYRQRYVIEHLYGLNSKQIKLQKDIGKDLGISDSMVQKIRDSGLNKIKKNKALFEELRLFL